MKKLFSLVSCLLLSGGLVANELSLDELIQNVQNKTDLSEKTRLENGGISFIYTRKDIERMQARNLKDILKLNYIFEYEENRYGVPDPFNMGSTIPFVSSNMRVFIDNQEIVAGTYGSGIVIIGDIDIGFVDHIEIYSQNPTYEYSIEPTVILVKLYTKQAQIDEGSSVSSEIDSYGGFVLRTYDTHQLEDFSYFAYASVSNRVRKKYKSHSQEVSRDMQDGVFLTSIKKDDTNVLILGRFQDRDMFMADVADASPTDSSIKSDYLHIGLDGKLSEHFTYLLSYDYLTNDSSVKDDLSDIKSKNVASYSHVFSSELKHTKKFQFDKLVVGLKYRLKSYYFPKIVINGDEVESTRDGAQSVTTAFVENQYAINENSIFTAGVSASSIFNSDSKQDDTLLMYRTGYTYTNEKIVSKTIYSYLENSLDAYFINSSSYLYEPNKKYELQKQHTFSQNIIYEENKDKYEMVFSYGSVFNYLIALKSTDGKLTNYDGNVLLYASTVRYTHKYGKYNKFFTSAEFLRVKDLPKEYIDKDYDEFKWIIRNINQYDKFEIFNQVSLDLNNYDNNLYCDYDFGVAYNYSDDFKISFKGENIFNYSRKMIFRRVDIDTNEEEQPLFISPIDQRFLINMEYKF